MWDRRILLKTGTAIAHTWDVVKRGYLEPSRFHSELHLSRVFVLYGLVLPPGDRRIAAGARAGASGASSDDRNYRAVPARGQQDGVELLVSVCVCVANRV